MRLREVAEARRRFGYRRLQILLEREGWQLNRKRVYRLYVEEKLSLRRKRGRKRAGTAGILGSVYVTSTANVFPSEVRLKLHYQCLYCVPDDWQTVTVRLEH